MNYLTLQCAGTGTYKDRGSKFLAFAYPVATEADIREYLSALRKKYHDARHHCYAYILGLESQQMKASDDGEPGHSAGDPILGQIRSAGLTNTLVVVVRYFGGIKLGVGGLINAYKTAAGNALKEAKTKTVFPSSQVEFEYDYQDTSKVERILEIPDLEIISREFTSHCSVRVSIRKTDQEMFIGRLKEAGIKRIKTS